MITEWIHTRVYLDFNDRKLLDELRKKLSVVGCPCNKSDALRAAIRSAHKTLVEDASDADTETRS